MIHIRKNKLPVHGIVTNLYTKVIYIYSLCEDICVIWSGHACASSFRLWQLSTFPLTPSQGSELFQGTKPRHRSNHGLKFGALGLGLSETLVEEVGTKLYSQGPHMSIFIIYPKENCYIKMWIIRVLLN